MKNTLKQDWAVDCETVNRVGGFLGEEESKYLYTLARDCTRPIVEIGSWFGKSTISLALGSKGGLRANVYAIDPHQGIADSTILIPKPMNTEQVFRDNIKMAGVENIVIPLVMTSREASKGWVESISLLFIDGGHDYDNVLRDFRLWAPHLADGGIVVFHDVLYSCSRSYPGIIKVVKKHIFKTNEFSMVKFRGSMLSAAKTQTTPMEELRKLYKLLYMYLFPVKTNIMEWATRFLEALGLLNVAIKAKRKLFP